MDGGLFAEHTDHWKPDEALPSVARLHFDVYALTIQSKAGNSLENKFSIKDSNNFLELLYMLPKYSRNILKDLNIKVPLNQKQIPNWYKNDSFI